jgi:MFS family permease
MSCRELRLGRPPRTMRSSIDARNGIKLDIQKQLQYCDPWSSFAGLKSVHVGPGQGRSRQARNPLTREQLTALTSPSADQRALRTALPIIIGAGVMLSVSMGIRQSFGLFVQPIAKDIALTISQFTSALAIQNVALSFFQPIAGTLVVYVGFRPVLVSGALLYVTGLAILASAQGALWVALGPGLLVGASMACTTTAMAQSVVSRSVPDANRSMALGIITGLGSLGALGATLVGQLAISELGWRYGAFALLLLALLLIPAAWFASNADSVEVPIAQGGQIDGKATFIDAIGFALSRASFVVMVTAYFICGMQLVFISVHLPSYLEICGMDPMLGATALSVISVANLFGSLFFGWAGGRWPKLVLLGAIYSARSLAIAWYCLAAPSPLTTLCFAAVAGFLWLGVGPLIAGAVVEMFGLRWQAMIQGLVLTSHHLGGVVGALGGGLLFDAFGSYDVGWRMMVGLGFAAGLLQLLATSAAPAKDDDET